MNYYHASSSPNSNKENNINYYSELRLAVKREEKNLESEREWRLKRNNELI